MWRLPAAALSPWSQVDSTICTLVKRIEVADDVVRVIFRVDPGFSSPPETSRTLHHCPTRRHHARDAEIRRAIQPDGQRYRLTRRVPMRLP